MKKRFNPFAIASSDGVHIRIKHDVHGNGRRPDKDYVVCGTIKIRVTEIQAKMLAPCQRMRHY